MRYFQGNASQSMTDLTEFLTTEQAARRLGLNMRPIPYKLKNEILEGLRLERV